MNPKSKSVRLRLKKRKERKERWEGIEVIKTPGERLNHAKRRERRLLHRRAQMGRCNHPDGWQFIGIVKKGGKKYKKLFCNLCGAEKLRLKKVK